MAASNTYSNPTPAGSRSILHFFYIPSAPTPGAYPLPTNYILDEAPIVEPIHDEAGFILTDES